MARKKLSAPEKLVGELMKKRKVLEGESLTHKMCAFPIRNEVHELIDGICRELTVTKKYFLSELLERTVVDIAEKMELPEWVDYMATQAPEGYFDESKSQKVEAA